MVVNLSGVTISLYWQTNVNVNTSVVGPTMDIKEIFDRLVIFIFLSVELSYYGNTVETFDNFKNRLKHSSISKFFFQYYFQYRSQMNILLISFEFGYTVIIESLMAFRVDRIIRILMKISTRTVR